MSKGTDLHRRFCPGKPGRTRRIRGGAPVSRQILPGELHEKVLSAGYRRTTNNRMELMAAIVALEALNRPCQVELYSDSKYLTDAFNQHWIDNWVAKNWMRGKSGPVKNIDLWERLLKAKKPHQVQFIWVKGHAGHPQNERCDKMAVAAALGEGLLEDPGVA